MQENVDAATPYILGAMVVNLLSSALDQGKSASFAVSSVHASLTARVSLFRHLHTLSHDFHLARQTGAVIRVAERGGQAVSQLVQYLVLSIVPTLVQLAIIVFIFLFTFDVISAVLAMGMFIMYYLYTLKMTNWRTALRREMNEADNAVSFRCTDSLINFETVKFCTSQEFEVKRMEAAIAEYNKGQIKVSLSLSMLNFGQEALVEACRAALLVLMGRQVLAGQFTPGDFVMLSAYLVQMARPLGFLGSTWRLITNAKVDLEKCIQLTRARGNVEDAPGAVPLQVQGGEIEFDNVSFRYNEDREILKGISFRVPAGKKVALVGKTGSGKSTIARLLLRCWDVTSGTIRVDGQDVRSVTLDSLRDIAAVIPQDVCMFNDTIGYNISYGAASLLGRACTQDEIEEAARVAQIHDFILSLPDGYDTVVGERGLKLSGGERQRVGVARAVIRHPKIFIADESTAALDTATERDIQAALDRGSEGITSVVVAHRLSTIASADEILVVHEGEIVERGDHLTLLGLGGRYANMWNAQRKEGADHLEVEDGSSDSDSDSEPEQLVSL
jgi:ATP-binding cassette subfamily B protein